MKTTLMTIAFATASLFAAQTPAPKTPAATPAAPAAATTQAKPAAVKTKKHQKVVKKSAVKATPAPAPVSK
jgi:hypothetical protein